jgi:nucleotide-binding universal stress UspA family protein
MKTVLAPIDFSSLSDAVVTEAVTLARRLGARLVLLHVVQPLPVIPPAFGAEPLGAELPAAASASAARRLRDLQRALLTDAVTAHTIHVVGEPGPRIVEQAERLEADFIVMGSHGHTALYDLVIGGTANFVLKRATCPLVLLPPHGATAPLAAMREAGAVGAGL